MLKRIKQHGMMMYIQRQRAKLELASLAVFVAGSRIELETSGL